MMDKLLNQHALHRAAQDGLRGTARKGLVASSRMDDYAVRVRLMPEDVLTGWCPVLAQSAGPGWGVLAMPQVGAQVLLLPVEGDGSDYVVAGALYSDVDQPPAGASSQAWWLVHESGSSIKLRAAGSVEITAPAGMTIDGNVTITGEATINGIAFTPHVHTDPQGGKTGGAENG